MLKLMNIYRHECLEVWISYLITSRSEKNVCLSVDSVYRAEKNAIVLHFKNEK